MRVKGHSSQSRECCHSTSIPFIESIIYLFKCAVYSFLVIKGGIVLNSVTALYVFLEKLNCFNKKSINETPKWHLGTVACKQDFVNVIKCGRLSLPCIYPICFLCHSVKLKQCV